MASMPQIERPRVVTFICNECLCTEHRPTEAIPQGWEIVAHMLAMPVVVCPDCAVKLRRERIAPIVSTDEIDEIPSLEPWMLFRDEGEALRRADEDPTFGLHLTRQLDGSYLVAMAPVRVLTLFQPLGFMLDADEAEQLAADLQHHAALVRNPGTLGSVA